MPLIMVEEMENLPEEANAAFVQLERICRSRLDEQVEKLERWEHGDVLRSEYMTIVSSAAQAYGIACSDPSRGEVLAVLGAGGVEFVALLPDQAVAIQRAADRPALNPSTPAYPASARRA